MHLSATPPINRRMEELSPESAAKKIREDAFILADFDGMLCILCDALNDELLRKLRLLKSRSNEKGFTILVTGDADINKYVGEVPSMAWDLLDASGASLILVLPEGRKVSAEALDKTGFIAIRMIGEPQLQKFIRSAKCPIACTILLRTDGTPAQTPEEADPAVLNEPVYLLNLPSSKDFPIGKRPPIIRLGKHGEVKIIRE